MSRLVVRVIEEDYGSSKCIFEHSREDDTVILQNEPAIIAESVEELDAAVSYLKSVKFGHKRSC